MVFLTLSCQSAIDVRALLTMKAESFPLKITESGVCARIRKATQCKNGRFYTSYAVEYTLLG